MSGKLVKEVLECHPDDMGKIEFKVLIALAEDASDKTRIANYVTIEELADRARTTPGTVDNLIRLLKQRMLITAVHGPAHNGKRQKYRIAELRPEHRKVRNPQNIARAEKRAAKRAQQPLPEETLASVHDLSAKQRNV